MWQSMLNAPQILPPSLPLRQTPKNYALKSKMNKQKTLKQCLDL